MYACMMQEYLFDFLNTHFFCLSFEVVKISNASTCCILLASRIGTSNTHMLLRLLKHQFTGYLYSLRVEDSAQGLYELDELPRGRKIQIWRLCTVKCWAS